MEGHGFSNGTSQHLQCPGWSCGELRGFFGADGHCACALLHSAAGRHDRNALDLDAGSGASKV